MNRITRQNAQQRCQRVHDIDGIESSELANLHVMSDRRMLLTMFAFGESVYARIAEMLEHEVAAGRIPGPVDEDLQDLAQEEYTIYQTSYREWLRGCCQTAPLPALGPPDNGTDSREDETDQSP